MHAVINLKDVSGKSSEKQCPESIASVDQAAVRQILEIKKTKRSFFNIIMMGEFPNFSALCVKKFVWFC